MTNSESLPRTAVPGGIVDPVASARAELKAASRRSRSREHPTPGREGIDACGGEGPRVRGPQPDQGDRRRGRHRRGGGGAVWAIARFLSR